MNKHLHQVCMSCYIEYTKFFMRGFNLFSLHGTVILSGVFLSICVSEG